jgi:DNA repair protein RadA/Sms
MRREKIDREPKRKQAERSACKVCSYRFDKTKALCPSCKHWRNLSGDEKAEDTVLLSEVVITEKDKIRIPSGPWDICFGPADGKTQDGIVDTSVALIGGMPGAGKSTLSLQLADNTSVLTKREILYIATEEATKEIKSRADRLQLKNQHLIRIFPMGCSADLQAILLGKRPSVIIVDSLPGLSSDPEMAVEICKRFKDYAIELRAPVLIIDHVIKADDFAGLMALQHAVDTLLTLYKSYSDVEAKMGVRQLTTIKNRNGRADVVVDLIMTPQGLIKGIRDNEGEILNGFLEEMNQ